jgi:uncharacterized OsmC-like protein
MSEVSIIETQAVQSNIVNGVNLDILGDTVAAIQTDPELGVARFRARNEWLAGNHNRSTVTGFFGAKAEQTHKQTFTMDADEPAILAGNDAGANPVEHLLHALASCITTSMVAHSAVRGIEIEALEADFEGDLDLNGFLGLDEETPKGYTEIRAIYRIRTDKRNLDRIKRLARFSPVYNTVSAGCPVILNVELM